MFKPVCVSVTEVPVVGVKGADAGQAAVLAADLNVPANSRPAVLIVKVTDWFAPSVQLPVFVKLTGLEVDVCRVNPVHTVLLTLGVAHVATSAMAAVQAPLAPVRCILNT